MEAPGSYIAAECAGVPVLVARGADGRLRAFYNVRAAWLCPRPACRLSTRRLPLQGATQAAPRCLPNLGLLQCSNSTKNVHSTALCTVLKQRRYDVIKIR